MGNVSAKATSPRRRSLCHLRIEVSARTAGDAMHWGDAAEANLMVNSIDRNDLVIEQRGTQLEHASLIRQRARSSGIRGINCLDAIASRCKVARRCLARTLRRKPHAVRLPRPDISEHKPGHRWRLVSVCKGFVTHVPSWFWGLYLPHADSPSACVRTISHSSPPIHPPFGVGIEKVGFFASRA